MKGAVGALVALGLVVGLLGTAVVGSAMAMFGIDVQPTATAAATSKIPPAMLALYQQAAATCPGLPWTILAAIGTVESDNGQSNLPGVHSGANAAGAEGPMQFEPATFAAYDEPVPPGGADPPSPYDPTDAVYAAARLLCANGGAGGADLSGAVYAYNHSAVLRGAGAGAGPDLRGGVDRDGRRRRGVEQRRRRGGVVGPVPDRHALRLGRRDAGRRLRLLGSGAGRLRRGGGVAPPGGPGPVRHHAEAGAGRTWRRAISSSSGAGRGPSTTSASSSAWWTARTSWSMRRTRVRTCGPRPSPRRRGRSFGSLLFVGATRPA